MKTGDMQYRLSVLLQQTLDAHHRAFIEVDGDDPEWPLWYAGYLQLRLDEEFGLALTQSELVYWLVRAEKQRLAEHSQTAWQDFYAEHWLAAGLL